jgi:hypothetical protein
MTVQAAGKTLTHEVLGVFLTNYHVKMVNATMEQAVGLIHTEEEWVVRLTKLRADLDSETMVQVVGVMLAYMGKDVAVHFGGVATNAQVDIVTTDVRVESSM